MNFLVSTNVPEFRSVLGDDTSRVTFCQDTAVIGNHFRSPARIGVWICEGTEVTGELLDQWVGRDRNSPRTLLVHASTLIPHLEKLSNGRISQIQATSKQDKCDSSWVFSTLRAGERLHARAACARGTAFQEKGIIPDGQSEMVVLMVGAGIMNLVAAEFLAVRGFQVRIVDAGPEPGSCSSWTRLGITHGGGDARMFTCTEADNYNERRSDIYHDMRHIFRRTVGNGGWSMKRDSSFSAEEASWVKAFETVPAWLAETMREDIYSVNQAAGMLWLEYMDRAPELFEDVSLRTDISRLYAEETALAAAREMNRGLGVLLDEYPQDELLKGFHTAVKSNALAGGFTVQGFTLGIHAFTERLMNRIIDLGGQFTWNCCVEHINRNDAGEVTSLDSELGPLEADHFVISTGVTRNRLLHGTASHNTVHGVLGVWLQIPNLHSTVTKSIKIHRRGRLVEDINITASQDPKTGEDILILGGGYGYVGLDYPSSESPELQSLFNELEQVAHAYFPEAYRCAKASGMLYPEGQRKFCIRPFTSTGLGIFEDIPTAGGGHLIITGGNNTGGFAQAPAIAQAVCRAVAGEHDPIHILFHPSRSPTMTPMNLKHSARIIGPAKI